MLLETVIGGIGGAILRTAPEVLAFFDRKNERAHELAIQTLSLQAAEKKAEFALREQEISRGASFDVAAVNALVEVSKAQAQPSGVKWVDALSAFVRPGITFAFFGLYALARIAAFFVSIEQGTPALQALAAVWSPEDQALLASILSFWFLGRVLDKMGR